VLRAIVFDFDGVIANSEPLHYRAYRDVLAERGVTLAEREYYGRYLGYDDYGAFVAIAADRGLSWSSSDIAGMITRKALRLEALERDGALLFPGAETAIRAAAAELPLGIASGALGEEIRRALDATRLAHCFQIIVAAEDTPASKPAPDPYRLAVARLSEACGQLAPHQCLAIEDSRWGLESARAAGLRTLAVAQTYPAHELQLADLVINSMMDFDLAALRAAF
jgi:HAD superfamily hydrolase (TIGR01509 family)